jgi:uncharacterized protein YdcH (DUF465 family)
MSHTPHELSEEFPNHHEKLHQLKVSNPHFNKLADEYHVINRAIHRYDAGVEATSDFHLHDLKKQRLYLVDELTKIIESSL